MAADFFGLVKGIASSSSTSKSGTQWFMVTKLKLQIKWIKTQPQRELNNKNWTQLITVGEDRLGSDYWFRGWIHSRENKAGVKKPYMGNGKKFWEKMLRLGLALLRSNRFCVYLQSRDKVFLSPNNTKAKDEVDLTLCTHALPTLSHFSLSPFSSFHELKK